MKYNVLVKPGTSQEKILEDSSLDAEEKTLVVWLRAKAHDGEANAALVKLLAKHFGVAKSRVVVVRGSNSRHKIVEID